MKNYKLISEMNKISNEIFGKPFIKRECILMGCRNKAIHKFQIMNIGSEVRFTYSCKKCFEDTNGFKHLKYVGVKE